MEKKLSSQEMTISLKERTVVWCSMILA